MIVRRQGDWMTAMIGEELLMMSPEEDRYIGLTAVGARIWELLENQWEIGALCMQLQREFDVAPDTCRAHVEEFLDALAKQGAVSLDR